MAELIRYFNKADDKFSFPVDGSVVTLSKMGDEINLTDSQFSGLSKELQAKLTDTDPLIKDKKVEFKK